MHRQPTTLTVSVGVGLLGAVADRDRVVAPDHLAEVARRRELVVQAAVDDEEGLAARHPCGRRPGSRRRRTRRRCSGRARSTTRASGRLGRMRVVEQARRGSAPIAARSSGCVLVEVRDAEAAAEVEVADRASAHVSASSQRELDRLALRLAEDLGVQVLRAGEDVEAEEVEVGRARAPPSSAGTCSASTPNCCGPPPIRIPEPLTWKSGLTRTATRGRTPSRSPIATTRSRLGLRLQLDRDAGGDGLRQLGRRLARARRS